MLDVIVISVDEVPMAQIRAFYNQLELTHLALYRAAPATALDALRVLGLPTTVLLDRQRREVAHLVGPTE